MKTIVLVVLIGFQTLSWGDEPRTWKLKSGVAFEAEFSGFAPPNQVVITKSQDRKAYRVSIADLSEADQVFLKPLLVIEQLKARGLIEFTTSLIKNFPEKVDGKSGWIDVKFEEIYSDRIKRSLGESTLENSIGFWAYDKNKAAFHNFVGNKAMFSKPLLELKRGDHIRVWCKAVDLGRLAGRGRKEYWLEVTAITKIAPGAVDEAKMSVAYTGRIDAVDKIAYTIKLSGEKSMVLKVHALTKITKDGKSAYLDALKVGDSVSGDYRSSTDGKMEARTIVITPRPPGEAK